MDDREQRRKQLDRLWKALEAERHASVPPEARGFLEEAMHLENLALYPDEDTIADLMDWFAEDALPAWKRCFDRTKMSDEALQRKRRGPAATRSARPRVYGKTQAQRLLLLRFMAERVIPVANRGVLSLDTAGHLIRWEEIYAEWKEEHPDYRGSTKSLARAYRRAKSDPLVCQLYFDREFQDWAKQVEALRPTLSQLEAAGYRPEDLFVRIVRDDSSRLRGTLSPKVAATFERANWPKEWVSISAKYPPKEGAAYGKAARANCVLTAWHFAFPPDTVFCEHQDCSSCRVYRALKQASILEVESEVLRNPQRLAQLRADLERQFRERFRVARRERVAPTPVPKSRNAERPTPSRRSRSSPKS
jgi:hypothetical protein